MKFTILGLAAIVAVTAASPAANPEAGSAATLDRRAVPILEFKCKDFPNVCKTQCYGAYCAGNGDQLRHDIVSKQEKRNRRKQAGCIVSGGNRCSVKKGHAKGFSCDEFPYASSTSKKTTARLNKCVPAKENSSQGSKLGKFYNKQCKGKACDFQVKMTGGGDLCNEKSTKHKAACAAEKKEIQQPGKQGAATKSDTSDDGSSDDSAKRSVAAYPLARRYVTSAGREVELDGENNIGRSIFQVVARNETLHEEQINNHVFDADEERDEFAYMEDNLDVIEEIVVKLL